MRDTDGLSSETERSNLPKNAFDKNLLQQKFFSVRPHRLIGTD